VRHPRRRFAVKYIRVIHCLITSERPYLHPLPVGIDGLERYGALLSILTPLSCPAANKVRRGTMETAMIYHGTVKSFDQVRGRGTIEADNGGEYLLFERSGIYQNPHVTPVVGQRLTYQLVTSDGRRCAVNLGNV
jgi:cold shock CspA family protein